MKRNSLRILYDLLAPEIRGRLGTLGLVLLLALSVTAAAKAPLLLIKPLWGSVMFPDSAAAPLEPAAQVEPGSIAHADQVVEQTALYRAFIDGFDVLSRQVAQALYGAEPSPDQLRFAALWTVAGLMLLLTLLGAAAIYAQILIARRLALELVVDLRKRIARHLLGLSMRYHSERKFGDMLSRVSSDVTKTLNVINLTLRDLIEQPMQVVGALFLAWTVAPLPTLTFAVLLPIAIAPIAILGRRVRKRSKKSLAKLGDSVEVLTQAFTGIRTVKAFRAEERELQRYHEANQGYLAAAMKMVRAVGTINASSHVTSFLGFTVVVCVAGWFAIRRPIFGAPEDMMIFLGVIGSTYQSVKRFTSTINKIQESAGAAERLEDLLAERPDIVERPDAAAIDSLGDGLSFEDVTFTYPSTEDMPVESPAIAGLTLEVRPGETLALVGPSGAGKTTLVDLIARFLDPGRGRITAGGRDLRELSLDAWTAMYAMVGQVPFLFHDTVRENIGYGKPGASQDEIEAAARAAHIHDFIVSLPSGYDTQVGDVGSRLSGGQRQRITIARAILKGAPLLLLDEATSALDSESEAEVQRALDGLRADRTVIVIAHRLSTIRDADRIAVLEAGRLVELGTHTELIAKNGAYARLHRVQFPEDQTQTRGVTA